MEMLTPKEITFVNLEGYRFWRTDLIPQWAIDEGYNPKYHEQFAVFGPTDELKKWRDENQLPPDKYPIHPASMGFHIDIYTRKKAEELSITQTIGATEYILSMQEAGLTARINIEDCHQTI